MNAPRPYGCRRDPAPPLGALAPDLTRSTTFAYPDAETLRAVGMGEIEGEFYPRYGHPVGRLFESRMASLEEADGAVAFASGLAAIHAVFCTLLKAGDAVAVSRYVYGGVEAMLESDLPRFGIEVRRFDPFAPGGLEGAVDPRLKLVHVETPTNPLCRVIDLRPLARLARRHGLVLSVDATFVPPPFQRPLALGADLSIHSATKMLGGHSDAQAGVVSGRHELLEPLEAFRRRTGAVLSPDTAWLLVRSLATLELRAERSMENAARLAAFLARHPRVRRVHYAGLPDHPDHATARDTLKGFGAMLSFEMDGGLAAAVRVYDRFRVVARAVSLGGIETLASLPLHTSHAMMTPEALREAGIDEGLVRLSVGIEPYEMLEEDLARALG